MKKDTPTESHLIDAIGPLTFVSRCISQYRQFDEENEDFLSKMHTMKKDIASESDDGCHRISFLCNQCDQMFGVDKHVPHNGKSHYYVNESLLIDAIGNFLLLQIPLLIDISRQTLLLIDISKQNYRSL